jgi:hypothetical protein
MVGGRLMVDINSYFFEILSSNAVRNNKTYQKKLSLNKISVDVKDTNCTMP